MHTVSVITPVGREDHYLVECGRSVEALAALLPAEVEWVLTSDGVDHDWIARTVERFDVTTTITGHQGETKFGPARTRNHGLRTATGNVIANIDSDDFYLPEAMAAMFTEFIDSGAPWIAGRIIDVTPDGKHLSDGPPIHLAGHVPVDGFLGHAQEHGYVPFSPTATYARRAVIEAVTGWDESRTFIRAEDLAMWARVSRVFAGR